MKIIIINPTHPSVQHISSVRAWRFAEELSVRGHQVILLCGATTPDLQSNLDDILTHDWRKPFILACPMHQDTKRQWVQRLPIPLHKALTAWRLVRHGGGLDVWVNNAFNASVQVQQFFVPDLIWATFGRLESPMLARRLAGEMGCPWIMDIKDNWELFVPYGLRRIMAWRTRGWSKLTANSRFTQEKARRWQREVAEIVYSGVDNAFLNLDHVVCPANDHFHINLIGGLYFKEQLISFLTGVRIWVERLSLPERKKITLVYLGVDSKCFSESVKEMTDLIQVENPGYLPVTTMASRCRNAALNAYIAHPGTFHHKLLELLACDRPVIAYPEENEESWDLARRVSGELYTPENVPALVELLDKIYASWCSHSKKMPAVVEDYSWASQANTLEQVMQQVVDNVRVG